MKKEFELISIWIRLLGKFVLVDGAKEDLKNVVSWKMENVFKYTD